MAAICLAVIVYLFLFSTIEGQNLYAMPSLLAMAWCFLASALVGLFHNKPEQITEAQSWWQKVKTKFKKALFSIMTIAFIFISLALLYATFRMLGIWSALVG